jgi:hypothetical protein
VLRLSLYLTWVRRQLNRMQFSAAVGSAISDGVRLCTALCTRRQTLEPALPCRLQPMITLYKGTRSAKLSRRQHPLIDPI